jgi:peptide/nickel transport system substrate-binding protein
MKKKRIPAVALILTFALIALAACGGSGGGAGTSSDDQKDGGNTAGAGAVLTIGHAQDTPNIDSAFAYDFDVNPITLQITEPLLIIDVSGEIKPRLAESWEEVDATTYVYNIRQGVSFSDGNPLTMDDVLFSLKRYANPDLSSYVGWMYDNVASIEQTDDWQITVKLVQPDATWKYVPTTTAGHIHEEAIVEKLGADYGTINGFPVGTGPYAVDKWDAGGDITLKYNEKYWGSEGVAPDITQVVFRHIPEESTRSLAAASGQIDIDLAASTDLLKDIEESEAATLLKSPKWGENYLTFNCQVEPFTDANARRAVASAIDIATIQESISKEYGGLTNSLVVPESLYGADAAAWEAFQKTAPKYEYDVAKAKEYLSKSAYPDGFEFDLTIDEYTWAVNVATAIQQQLAEIGVTMEINKVSNDEATSQQFGSGIVDGKRPYQAGIFEWVADFPDAGGMVYPILHSEYAGEDGSNFAAYSNEKVDTLLNEQNAETDPAKRLAILQDALQVVGDEQPYYILVQTNWLFSVNKRIENAGDILNAAYIWYFPIQDMKISS